MESYSFSLARMRRAYFYRKFEDRLSDVPLSTESILLEPIGNHNRGTIFRNTSYLINERLQDLISGIAGSIDGFDYGRFDVKAESLESLYSGKGIKILELNGVNSEPAHIYDPGYSLLHDYRDIARHMRIIFRIGIL